MTPDFQRKCKLGRGFTLIEILIVITIIGILSTLLIVGISHLKTSANRQQTHQLLQNCQAWWNEYDASQHYHFDQFELDSPGNVSADLEAQTEAANPNSTGGDRIGIPVILTRCVFEAMRNTPKIKLSMEQFPSGRMFLPVHANGLNNYFGTPPSWQTGQHWIAGYNFCSQTTNSYGSAIQMAYLATTTHWSSDGSFALAPGAAPTPYNAPPNPACWFPLLYDQQVPVLLDAWGNPIICVMGGVLGNGPVGTSGEGASGTGYLTAGGVHVQVVSPDKRLFFASAGPDNDFSKGDDNQYSFDFK